MLHINLFIDAKCTEIESLIAAGALTTSSNQSKRKKSITWKHMNEVYDGETQITEYFHCTICNRVIFCAAKKDGNINSLARHECMNVVNGEKRLIVKPDIHDEIKKAATMFVVKDLRPFYAIEGEGLLQICVASMHFGQAHQKASIEDLKKTLPSRNTVKKSVEDIVGKTKEQIRKDLQSSKEIGGFAVSTDGWTDKYNSRSYICLVAHVNLINSIGIERKRYMLHCNEMTEVVKTKQVILSHILNVMNDYGFDEEQTRSYVTFVTDRGSNFKYGLTTNGFDRHECINHLIHNLVKAMLHESPICDIIKKAMKLTAYVKNTNINARLSKALKQFVATRWNGVHEMLSLINQNFNEIHDLLYDRQRNDRRTECLQLITDLKQNEIAKIASFLKQFKEISDKLEAETYETISMVWPTLKQIDKVLVEDLANEDEPDTCLIEKMKLAGRFYILKNYTAFSPTMTHKIATVLNPLFKRLSTIEEAERFEVYGKIKSLLPIPDEPENTPDTESRPVSHPIHPFFDSFCHIDAVADDTPLPIPNEFEIYLKHPIKTSCFNVTAWWNENKLTYPNLFKIFAHISAIPASSSSGERTFSRSGNIVTSHRNRILPENVNNLIIAGNNII